MDVEGRTWKLVGQWNDSPVAKGPVLPVGGSVEVVPLAALRAVEEERDELREALSDESHNRASAASAAQRYGYALSDAVDVWEAEFGGNEEPEWVTTARAALRGGDGE